MKDSGNTTKIDLKVSFPLQINMLPYTNRARTQDNRENFELARSCTYDLLSVVVHVGTIDTGHYISYSRVGSQVSTFSWLSGIYLELTWIVVQIWWSQGYFGHGIPSTRSWGVHIVLHHSVSGIGGYLAYIGVQDCAYCCLILDKSTWSLADMINDTWNTVTKHAIFDASGTLGLNKSAYLSCSFVI